MMLWQSAIISLYEQFMTYEPLLMLLLMPVVFTTSEYVSSCVNKQSKAVFRIFFPWVKEKQIRREIRELQNVWYFKADYSGEGELACWYSPRKQQSLLATVTKIRGKTIQHLLQELHSLRFLLFQDLGVKPALGSI